MQIDEKAAEVVFQKFKHVRPRLNRAAIGLLCAEYEAAKQTVGWQPIETAPRDGSVFIGWEPQTEYQKEGGYAEQGNYDLCTWRDDGFYSEGSLKPTHWIPTPLPPTKKG